MLVLNQSEPLTVEDQQLIDLTKDKKRIVLLNKVDLPSKIDFTQLTKEVGKDELLNISVLKNEGINKLEEKIAKLFFGGIENSQTTIMVTNARHIGLLNQARDSLDSVLSGIEANMPVDLIQIDMTNCWDLLGEITGDSYQDELLTQLFSQFCLGK